MRQVTLSKSHKEPDSFDSRDVLGKRFYLLMMKKIHIFFTNLVEIILRAPLHWLSLDPVTICPVGTICRYLAKIDLRIKVCGKWISVVTAIAVKDINRVNLIKIVF